MVTMKEGKQKDTRWRCIYKSPVTAFRHILMIYVLHHHILISVLVYTMYLLLRNSSFIPARYSVIQLWTLLIHYTQTHSAWIIYSLCWSIVKDVLEVFNTVVLLSVISDITRLTYYGGGRRPGGWPPPPQLYPGDTHEALPNLTLKKLTPFLNGLKNVFFQ